MFELPVIVDIVRDTKVGQGLKFLPRSTSRLKQCRDDILNSNNIESMTRELKAISSELKKRKEMTMK